MPFKLKIRSFLALAAFELCFHVVGPLSLYGQPAEGGDRGFRGGEAFRGGPFQGGPPGMGGDRGFRGGPAGSGGGERGGFDPSQFLSRLDANGNGSIDPEEMQGPAQFMLDRMARDNQEVASAIASKKPIPISKITKIVEEMRGNRDSASSSNSSSNNSSSGKNSSQPAEPEPLVPKFGIEVEVKPILGFGPEGESSAALVKVEERDLKEAKERIERYDRNKDGKLDEKEVGEGRWSDNPWSFDRNRDKILTEQELAMRYAKRRQMDEANRSSSSSNRSSMASRQSGDSRRAGNSRDERRDQETPSPWSNQASYKYTTKSASTVKAQGLPDWFTSSDTNQDGQVMMNEYALNWDELLIAEFNRFDTNGDGAITTLEALASVKKGILRGSSVGSATASRVSSSSPSATAIPTSAPVLTSSSAAVAATLDRSDLPKDADERWVKFVAGRISRADKDTNGRLTIDEWSASDGDFRQVDTNGDGSVSLGELYNFRKNRK